MNEILSQAAMGVLILFMLVACVTMTAMAWVLIQDIRNRNR